MSTRDDNEPADETSPAPGKGKRPYCICGLSEDMPWCDGSHTGKHRKRKVAGAAQSLGMSFCSCGRSSKAPFCDPDIEDCPERTANA